MGASVCHPRAVSDVPRGARTSRGPLDLVDVVIVGVLSTAFDG
jgi:hypothetical protein